MRRLLAGTVGALLLLLLLLTASAQAATFTVTTTADSAVGDDGCQAVSCTLRQAITAANGLSGTDTVDVPAGSYVLANGELLSTESLFLQRAGADTVTIDGDGQSRVLRLTAAATLSHLTITGGLATDSPTDPAVAAGGGIWSSADVLLDDVTVTDNHAAASGGGDAVGGGMWIDGQLSIGSATFSDNSAATTLNGTAQGGGLALGANATGNMFGFDVEDNLVSTEDGAAGGAGIHSAATGLQRFSGVIRRNAAQATGSGDAIGAGLWTDGGGAVAVSDTSVTSNVAVSSSGGASGGGAVLTGAATIERSTFDHNRAQTSADDPTVTAGGGGATVIGNAQVTNSTFWSNQAIASGDSVAQGGGLAAFGGTATILGATINLNESANADTAANGQAGGLFLGSPATLSGSILSGNTQGAGTDCDDSGPILTSGGGNVVYAGVSCGFTSGPDDARTDAPELDGLLDSGGPTPTVRPLSTSPALGRYAPSGGTCQSLTIDQRGIARPQRGTCDAGAVASRPAAFELSGSPSSLAFGSVDLGTTSPAQTVSMLNVGDLPGSPAVALGGPDAGQFTATACGNVVPDDLCGVSVAFAPAVAGAASATLSGATATVALSGTGVRGEVPPPSGAGGSVPQCRDVVAATGYRTTVGVKLDCSATVWRWAIERAPEHGTLSAISTTGELTYTPDPGFSGDDRFRYVAERAGGQSAPATFVVRVGAGPEMSPQTGGDAPRSCPTRRVTVRLNPSGVRFVRARVSVDGVMVRPRRSGTRWTASFQLEGAPGHQVTVHISGRRHDGRLLQRTRTLTVC